MVGQQLRADLSAALTGAPSPLAAADRLCQACVDLLEVDGASISVVQDGTSRGTFGSSSPLSRRLDEFQFTFGEGPCLDAVSAARPVMVTDLGDEIERRWPAFGAAMLQHDIRAVFAMPVSVARTSIGALDLFRRRSGALSADQITGGIWAADLAALPLLDLMTDSPDWTGTTGEAWDQLASLERVEVYQATGMIIEALDVRPAEALVRLRGYAFSHDMTASEVAWAVVHRRLVPDAADWVSGRGQPEATDRETGPPT